MRTRSDRFSSLSRWLSAAVVLAALNYPSVSVADVLWSWSFSTESGTFITTGTFAQTSGPAVFTFKRFSVSASQIGANVGASYTEGSDAPETMSWDGSQPTQFARKNGLFTNGSNFYSAIAHYVLNAPNALLVTANPGNLITSGQLTVAPVREVTLQDFAPVASATGIALLTGVMLLGAALSLRRHQNRAGG